MLTELKPYERMKDSGVEWLGEVPAHWDLVPGRACFREKKQPNTSLQETTVLSLSYGRIVVKPPEKLHGLVPSSFETYQIVDPLDIVVRPTDLQNDWNSLRFGHSEHRGIITSAYLCFLTTDRFTPGYGYLLLHSYDLIKVFYGLGSGLRQNLDWADFKRLPCVVPPVVEQGAIARFLERAVERIDRYVRGREKLIVLLEEQKQVVIQDAVTGRIDVRTGKPYPTYKPSGVDWLGDIPSHWEIRRLRTTIDGCIGGTWGSECNGRDDLACVRVADFDRASLRVSLEKRTIRAVPRSERARRMLKKGDLLLEKSGGGDNQPVGAVVLYDHQDAAVCSNFVARMPVASSHSAEFLVYLNSHLYARRINTRSIKQTTGIQNLDSYSYLCERIAVPSVSEQSAIVRFLDETCASIDSAVVRARRAIDLLREYRTRLIADVVTGKLDVREAVAELPDANADPSESGADTIRT